MQLEDITVIKSDKSDLKSSCNKSRAPSPICLMNYGWLFCNHFPISLLFSEVCVGRMNFVSVTFPHSLADIHSKREKLEEVYGWMQGWRMNKQMNRWMDGCHPLTVNIQQVIPWVVMSCVEVCYSVPNIGTELQVPWQRSQKRWHKSHNKTSHSSTQTDHQSPVHATGRKNKI